MTVNDRAPHVRVRIIDVSEGTAERIGTKDDGTAPVRNRVGPEIDLGPRSTGTTMDLDRPAVCLHHRGDGLRLLGREVTGRNRAGSRQPPPRHLPVGP